MTVRLAEVGDAEIVSRLLADFNAEFETWSPDRATLERRFARLLGRDDVLIVLGDDAEPCGFGLATLRPSPYYDGPVATLDELYVVPGRRGEGLGSQLVATLMRALRSRGCGEVQINVDEDDAGARRFYEARGFVNQEPGSSERMLCYLLELGEGARG